MLKNALFFGKAVTVFSAQASADARAFKVGGPKFFIDFSPGKACRT